MEIKIKYNGPVADFERKGMNIPRVFEPINSYIDTPVFTEGYPNEDSVGDGETYGKSIYATNVDGLGAGPGLLPMNSTTVKFAQFERAVMFAAEAAEKEEENTGITFNIDDDNYEEQIQWEQMSRNMATRGFYIKVGDKEFGEDVATEGGNGDDSGN